MKLTSSCFDNQQQLPVKYGYRADNINPPLTITGVPVGTKSFALIVHDPDAPSGNFTHWLAWNIPVTSLEIKEGELPVSVVQGCNDFGNNKWDGPAPPSGVHRYIFTVYALNSELNLQPGANRSQLELAIKEYILDQAQLVGLFKAS